MTDPAGPQNPFPTEEPHDPENPFPTEVPRPLEEQAGEQVPDPDGLDPYRNPGRDEDRVEDPEEEAAVQAEEIDDAEQLLEANEIADPNIIP